MNLSFRFEKNGICPAAPQRSKVAGRTGVSFYRCAARTALWESGQRWRIRTPKNECDWDPSLTKRTRFLCVCVRMFVFRLCFARLFLPLLLLLPPFPPPSTTPPPAMTFDDRTRPAKSPAKPKALPKAGQPAMVQKSLFSFFKTAAPVPPPSHADATNLDQGSSSAPVSTLPTTPIRPRNVAQQDTSPLFSTDESVLQPHKRKRMNLSDGEDDDTTSPVMQQADESHSVKKFAAAVSNLSLGSTARNLRFEDMAKDREDEDEDEDEPVGSRRSVCPKKK